jgi:DNA-binding MarR family transcriptional regulator
LNYRVRVGDGPTPLAIAQAFQLPKTSMTRSLTVPKRAGLTEIRNDPREGRSKLVFTMEAVQRFRQEAMNALAPDESRIAAAFPPEQVARMLRVLEILRKFPDADREPSPRCFGQTC